ncbi:MAG: chloride channel protein [Burkholderiaceae bacterium]|nr:chloride channel protein [Burkholderiaceae bacterium]
MVNPTPARTAPAPVLWLFAILAGLLAVAATTGFRAAITAVQWLTTGQVGSLVESARHLPPWQRVLIGAVGGLLAGLVLHWGGRWATRGPQGGTHVDYLDAARTRTVDLNDRTTWVRSVSALLSVGSGASIGREGPMIQLAAWLSAKLAHFAPLSTEQRTVIMICGIASGIGAAYHAPVAGVVFVLELALGFLSASMMTPVLIAAATSGVLVYGLTDPIPLYAMPRVRLAPTSLGMALAIGIVCGVLGWAMLAGVERFRSAFRRIDSLPLRLGAGGLLVGGLSAYVPEVWGNGFSTISQLLQGQILWPWVAVILMTKFAATLLNTGSGAIGGMFTPTLFVGAAAGFSLAELASMGLPVEWVGDPRTLAVIAMSAMLSAVTHAPLMAIVMVLEMTNQFHLTVPITLACGVALAISMQSGVRPMYGNPIEAKV